jgi:putative hydrolase of the HAD superfamily
MAKHLLENLRAVIFDVGNTLTTPDWERVNAITKQFSDYQFDEAALQIGISKILLQVDNDSNFLKNLADKTIRPNWHFRQLYQRFGIKDSQLEQLGEALDKLHQEKHLWTKLNNDVVPVFEHLKSKGFLLGVISNSEDGRVEDILREVGILSYLDVYLDSHKVEFAKPDPRIFKQAIEQIRVDANEAVFVGDTYMQDIRGAQASEIRPILFDPLNLHTKQEGLISIRSLRELIE